MSERQDRIYPRTAADLERKYNYEKRFAEIMGVALDAQKHVEETEALMKAELSLKLGYDENDRIVSMLNASADIINITGDRLTIDSTHFHLSEDGTVYATAGNIGGCTFEGGLLKVPAARISGKLTADQIYVDDLSTVSAHIGGWDIGSSSLESMFIDDNQDSTHFILRLNSNVGAGDNFIEVYAENDDYTDYNDTFFTLSTKGEILAKDITLIHTIKFRETWEDENHSGESTYELYLDHDTNTVKFRVIDHIIDGGGDTGDDETFVTVDGGEYYDVVGAQSEFPYSKAHDEYFRFYISGQASTVYSCLTIKANGDVYYNTTLVYDASENLVTEGMDGYIQPVAQSVEMTEEFGNWFKSTMV